MTLTVADASRVLTYADVLAAKTRLNLSLRAAADKLGMTKSTLDNRLRTPDRHVDEASQTAAAALVAAIPQEPQGEPVLPAPQEAQIDEAMAEWLRGDKANGAAGSFGGDLFAEKDDLLALLRAARIEPGQDWAGSDKLNPQGFIEFGGPDEDHSPPMIPPIVTRRHVRGEVGALIAQPGVGKSKLSALSAVALSAGTPHLLGETSFDWPGDVIIVNNEDAPETIKATITAVRREYQLEAQTAGRIHVWPSRLTLLEKTNGGVSITRAGLEFLRGLVALRRERSIALIVFDTVASIMSGASENDNADMQAVINLANEIARAAFCAVELVHHLRKDAGASIDLSDMRGAGALGAGVRRAAGLELCSAKIADVNGWDENQRRRRICLRQIKPRIEAEQWFEFHTATIPARDPRGAASGDILLTIDTGFLKPVAGKVIKPRDAESLEAEAASNPVELDRAFAELVALHRSGERLRLGSLKGSEHKEAASSRLREVSFVSTSRKGAQALVEKLIAQGRLRHVDETIRTHVVACVIPVMAGDEGDMTGSDKA